MNQVDIKGLTKLYYSIGEVAEMFGVNTSLIRFWEKEFAIIQPKKNRKGNRMFTPKDIENFNKIYHLVKEQGFTLDGAKKSLKEKSSTSPTVAKSNTNDVIDKLELIKVKLLNLKNLS